MTGSPWFWVVVGILTTGFALVDVEAMRRRSMSRMHGVAVAAYVLAWGTLFVYGLPIAPLGSISYVIPFAVRVGAAIVFAGGQLLAELVREERKLTGKSEPLPPVPHHLLTAAELAEAERYDDEWQIADRERERRLREPPASE
jgi:hypothetical protein